MDYFSVEKARGMDGLRLVLTAHVPGPWGESAKSVFSWHKVSYIPVEQTLLGVNEQLYAWTGVRNAPVAVLNDEPPVTGWFEILQLAERLGSGVSLLPENPVDRQVCVALSNDICGKGGFGWSCRLAMLGEVSADPASQDSFYLDEIKRAYGVGAESASAAPVRVATILGRLRAQLSRQADLGSGFIIGDRLSACDLYWACFSQVIAPLPDAACPMPAGVRELYSKADPIIVAALDPILIRHRDMIFEHYIGLPMDF